MPDVNKRLPSGRHDDMTRHGPSDGVRESATGTVSVVVRVRNAAKELDRCLSALRRQRLSDGGELEIVVVDNDSTDDSAAVARRHAALVVPISQAEFSWGRALNRGIAKTRGDIVILLSSDVTPVDDQWLENMLAPFVEPDVGIVYGRQLPYPDAPVDERVRLRRTFGEQVIVRDGRQQVEDTGRGFVASNACAALRRSLWQEQPYDEQTSGGEEGPFTRHALQRGFRCYYWPAARACHSHRDGMWKYACREWEILYKNLAYAGMPLKKRSLLRWWAGVAKRRLVNCLAPAVPLCYRIEGLLRLPLDLGACVIVGGLMFPERSRHKVRQVFWR